MARSGNKKEENIKIILGTELHIKNHVIKPAYHCHIYFDIKNKKSLIKNIASYISRTNEFYEALKAMLGINNIEK